MAVSAGTTPVSAGPLATFFFSTGNPDAKMGMASRPGANGQVETEAADDFLLAADTTVGAASFIDMAADSDITLFI